MTLSRIDGKTIYLRFVEISDAEQILALRTNPELARYLVPTENSLEKQIAYLHSYKKREAEGREYYYAICRRDNDSFVGCLRIHDIGEKSTTWGSWILGDNKTTSAAIESIMLMFTIGFIDLQLDEFIFTVDCKNKKAVSFYEKIGARRIGKSIRGEPPIPEYCFCFNRAAYDAAMKKFRRYILPAVNTSGKNGA